MDLHRAGFSDDEDEGSHPQGWANRRSTRLAAWPPGKSKGQRKPSGRAIARHLSPPKIPQGLTEDYG